MTRRLIPSFVTTVATASAAIVAGACGINVTTFDGDTCDYGDPGCEEACPSSAPSDGQSCQQDGQACAWDDWDGCSTTEARCDDGRWSVVTQPYPCNPPPPEPTCPATLPEPGSYCEPSWMSSTYRCEGYIDPFCGIPIGATCTEEGVWQVDLVSCNPPPPDYCREYADYDSCGSDSGCRWLVPGCEAPALEVEGCHSALDCTPGSCDAGFDCQVRIHDPCWNLDCAMCAAEALVCAPLEG